MSMKKTTTVCVVQPNKKKTTKRKNKSRSNARSSGSSMIIGQERSVPISKTIQTSGKMSVKNYRFPRRIEMLSTILGSPSEFALARKIILNPGDPTFSTWSSSIANCFESYKFHRLKVFYVPRCPTTKGGEVFLSPDMNPRDPAPTDEVSASQNEKTKSSSSWDKIEVVFSNEMLSKRKSYFCRKFGNVADNADIDLYDTGNLFVMVGGQSDLTKIGQLWVDYEVEFFTPESVTATQLAQTQFTRQTTGLSNLSPVVGNAATLIQENFGDFVESINQVPALYDEITFKKPFHGIIDLALNGTGISTGATPMAANNGLLTVSDADNGFTIGQSIANSAGAHITKIIDAQVGGKLGIALTGATSLTNSVLSMTSCYL